MADLSSKGFPSVAVVILSWNGKAFLEKFLPSVCGSTYSPLLIYVADNASSDDTISFLKSHFPQVQVIGLPVNHGYAGGYNEALDQISCDYCILLNQDVEVTPGWIEPVISLMQADPGMAACQPKILSFQDKSRFEYAGAAGGWMDTWGYTFCKGRIFDTMELDTGQYDEPAEIFWASGAALFVRSSVFKHLGGFDPEFFAHMEEVDLCWRIHLAGYRVGFCPQSIVYHVGGGSLPRSSPRKTYLNYRNNLMMMAKNLPAKGKSGILFFRRVLDTIAAVKQAFQGNFSEFRAIILAHFAFRRWWNKARQDQAKFVKSIKKLEDLPGVYDKSIIWQYFIKRRKRFSDLKILRK